MVERLKDAISKARQRREELGGLKPRPAAARAPSGSATARAGQPFDWEELEEVVIDPAHLRAERVVTFDKTDPIHVTYDVLRTRLMRAMRENGWTRIAVTSPTKGCGKTVTSANLAFSLSRNRGYRTALIDLDLRSPRLSGCLGVRREPKIARYLSGELPPERFLVRHGDNIAFGLSSERVRDSSELIANPTTAATIARTQDLLKPDLFIFDLPPLLVVDDALAFMPNVDCVLLVIAAGETRPADVDECERLLSNNTNFLGVLLNKHEREAPGAYGYGYGYGGSGGYGAD